MGLTPQDIVCCPPPLFHCFGSILGYMATATTGAALLLPSEAFNPTATLLSIQEERATALYGVATMFVAELELLANKVVEYKGFEHLRTGIAAGSSVPSSLMEKLHKTLNLTGLTICYGMTETSPVSCMTTPDDPLIKRVDSVGRLLPHVSAKVVSVTDGKTICIMVRCMHHGRFAPFARPKNSVNTRCPDLRIIANRKVVPKHIEVQNRSSVVGIDFQEPAKSHTGKC